MPHIFVRHILNLSFLNEKEVYNTGFNCNLYYCHDIIGNNYMSF